MLTNLRLIVWGVGIAPLLFALAAFAWLPERVAMQWGLDGKPTWFASRVVFVAFMLVPAIIAWLTLEGPVSAAIKGQPASLYFTGATLAVVALALIGATIANLMR